MINIIATLLRSLYNLFCRYDQQTIIVKYMNNNPLSKINSINELYNLAIRDERYRKLALISASNLGEIPRTLLQAIAWLKTNAMETDEQSVLDEINFCRDMVR